VKLRSDRTSATAANDIWATDFVHDQFFDGTKLRLLTVVDTFTRLLPAFDVRHRYRGRDVVETRAAGEIGFPKTIRVDNGPEFVSKEMDLWAFMKLQPPKQAGRPRLHRIVERQVQARMSERQLVQPRRSTSKMGGSA
jgi:transposase InsO family protein